MIGREETGGSDVHGHVPHQYGRQGGTGLAELMDDAAWNADAVLSPVGHDGFDCEQTDGLGVNMVECPPIPNDIGFRRFQGQLLRGTALTATGEVGQALPPANPPTRPATLAQRVAVDQPAGIVFENHLAGTAGLGDVVWRVDRDHPCETGHD